MKMISVSEAALDSIQRMGEADKARIAELEGYLRDISKAMREENFLVGVADVIDHRLRVSTNVQPIAKSEN